MAMLVGYQQMSACGDREELEKMLDEYLGTLVYARRR